MTTDYYNILGVQRTATDHDIKSAYRRMASKHHPDKGGDTAKFQELQKAYETLSNATSRHEYDNPSPFQQPGNPGNSHFEFNFGGGAGPGDIFSQFFSQGFGGVHQNPFHAHPRRNKDLRVSITVPLASTLDNQTKSVNIQTTNGDTFNVDVTIPRGAGDGTTIKYTQLGDNIFDTLTRGDLYVIINVTADPRFQIQGDTVLTNLEINSIEAMLGSDKEVVGIDGKVFLIKIPVGCQFGTKFGLSGQGLYSINSNHRGDLIANISIVTPTLTEEQILQLQNMWYSS